VRGSDLRCARVGPALCAGLRPRTLIDRVAVSNRLVRVLLCESVLDRFGDRCAVAQAAGSETRAERVPETRAERVPETRAERALALSILPFFFRMVLHELLGYFATDAQEQAALD
jgi:hypothetical protein